MMNSHQVVDFLNQLVSIDREAIEKLIASRVKCNKELADHPTVQVFGTGGDYWVGILGILNGIYGCNSEGVGFIQAHLDDDLHLVRFASTEPVPEDL